MDSRPRQNGRKRQGPARRSVATGLVIPQIRTNVVKYHRFRFAANAAFSNGITATQILGSLGGICIVTNTTFAQMNRTFRVRKLFIWAPTSTSTTPSTCSIEWIGLTATPNLEVSDTSVNQSRPAHIESAPPAQSLASFWQQTGATNIFVLICPSGSIVDLSIEYIENDQAAATGTNVIAAGVLGEVYYLALDGPATNILRPVSLNTTA